MLRLWALAVGANVLGLLVAVLVAKLVRNGAVTGELSTTAESALRFGYWAVLAIVAAADTLFLDEWLSQGAFRKTHLLPEGRVARAHRASSGGADHAAAHPDRGDLGAREDDEVAALSVSLRSNHVTIVIFLLFSGVGTYFLFNAMNRGFDPWYARIGRHLHVLRSEASDPRKVDAIEALAVQSQPETIAGLDRALASDALPVARHAAWALGVQARSPMRPIATQPLVRALDDARPEVRREVALALARLQYRAASDALIAEATAELARDRGTAPFDLRLLWGLGFQQDPAALPLLARALRDGDPEVARVSAWAIAQHRDQRLEGAKTKSGAELDAAGFSGPRPIASVLEQRLTVAPFEIRCGILHALMIVKDERSNLALIDAYEATAPVQRREVCPMTILRLDPQRRADDYLIIPTETYAIATLEAMGRMRATAPEIRAIVEPWLDGVAKDPEASLATRESAASLAAGIRTQRDDFAGK
jgi:HEAT repeat protein